jgi:hypothetical protein
MPPLAPDEYEGLEQSIAAETSLLQHRVRTLAAALAASVLL